jgi:ribosome-binding factor A
MEFDFTLPGLGKPQSSRPKRVAEAIKNELSILLLREVADPRLSEVTFSQVEVSPDLKYAKIFFVMPADGDSKKAFNALKKAKGFFRSRLAKAINLRYTPELIFHYDSANEKIDRMEEIFMEINAQRKKDGRD